jgi:DNA-binding FrmR family transcriptional regulator
MHMGHTIREKNKLIARVRRIRGQVEAVERALESETECTDVLRLIASVRGAVNGLMGEVMEDHILEHVVGAANADARTKSAEEFAEIVKAYVK